jgi:hypothetical protein
VRISVVRAFDKPPEPTAPKRPWLKFFPSDWRGDAKLAMCSLAARGLLIELVCVMHEAEPRGHLIVNGVKPSDNELTRLVRATSVTELHRLLGELVDKGVLSVAADGGIYSRRMVRETTRAAIGHETGKLGGNPNLRPLTVPHKGLDGEPVNGAPNPHIPDAIFQNPLPPSGGVLDEGIDEIAGSFLERYPEIYARCRSGATYRVNRLKQERDLGYARELARGWPDLKRLEDMLDVFLRRTDLGEKNKPGTPGQFLHMAPDCDRLLKEHGR